MECARGHIARWHSADEGYGQRNAPATIEQMTAHAADHEVNAEPVRGTVWVNGPDGSCIGRFSKRFGIDVHRTATAQLAGEGECIMCTHSPADHAAWLLFVRAMQEHHGVAVPGDLLTWP